MTKQKFIRFLIRGYIDVPMSDIGERTQCLEELDAAIEAIRGNGYAEVENVRVYEATPGDLPDEEWEHR